MASKCKARLRTTNILSIIVADRELCVRSLFITVINNANITATKYRAFIRVISNSKLSEIEVEFLTHIQRKDEGFQWLICCPLLFSWTPRNRCIPTNYLAKLCFNQCKSSTLIIAFLMELFNREGIFTCPEQEFHWSNFTFEQSMNSRDVMNDLTIKSWWSRFNFSNSMTNWSMSLVFCTGFQIKVTCMIQKLNDLLLKSNNFTFNQARRFHLFSRK